MHLANAWGIAFRVEVASDWGVLNFSIRACLLACMGVVGG